VCRKPRGGARSGGEDRKEFAGVAFTAWPKEARAPAGVWLVDSESTQHITVKRSQFASYERLARPQRIEGLGGEALAAVGIGRVVLEGGRAGDWQPRLGSLPIIHRVTFVNLHFFEND
jgi:hypothetical protein